MQIVIKANTQQKEEILSKDISPGSTILWLDDEKMIPAADAYFDLGFEDYAAAFAVITDKPVFVNSVITTCAFLPANYIRINAWDGFLQREILEIAAADPQVLKNAADVLARMNWKYQPAPDTPGMIAARVIAMIINEAYFGLGDAISTKKEIDTAMKLGTNYPYGPFEWSEKIGLHKIYALLNRLAELDNRYAAAPALEKEIMQHSPITQ